MNTKLGTSGCFVRNLGELLEQIDVQFSEGDKIKIPIEKIPILVGLVWNRIQSTFEECEGKQISIEFGDSAAANAIEGLLKLLLDLMPKDGNQTT